MRDDFYYEALVVDVKKKAEIASVIVGDRDLREVLSAVQHQIWSYWMEYLFGVCVHNEDGSVLIPEELVTRWAEQLKTDYFWLTEDEKDSDRNQADRVLSVLRGLGVIV